MPTTEVLLYREDDGSIPVLDWLTMLKRKNRRAFDKSCICSMCLNNSGESYAARDPTFFVMESMSFAPKFPAFTTACFTGSWARMSYLSRTA